MRFSNTLLVSWLCLGSLGCGDDDGSDPEDSGMSMVDGATDTGIDPSLDTDEDGLSDLDEVTVWRTSPTVADTDGDGFDDGVEVNELAFDPEVNNFQFNPLIADRPQLEIELSQAPVIYATYETSTGTSQTIGEERSNETSMANSRSWGGSNSYAVETSHTVGGSTGFSGWKLEAKVNYEYSYSTTNETTSNWSNDQTTENSSTLSEMESFEESNEITSSGGVLAVSVQVRNPGNIAYFLDNLTLTAYELDPVDPDEVTPVGTLTFLDGSDTFPRTRLEPGETSAPLSFATELDLPTTKALLANSRNLMIAPATWLVEGDGTVDFELAATAVNARTAEIVIDFGSERAMETYRVSTVGDDERNSITVEEVLTDVLRIPFEQGIAQLRRSDDGDPEDTAMMLTSVRGLGTSDEDSALWTVLHNYSIESGASTEVNQYHPFADGVDFGALELRKGDTLQLVRIVDVDRDNLGERAEYAYGTDPLNADTDGDGCEDGLEVAGWTVGEGDDAVLYRSNPLLANSDFDLFSDCEEMEMGTDPMSADNTRPMAAIEIQEQDGTRAVFRVTYSDIETAVLELRYTVDGGAETVIDVSAETSPFDFELMFSDAGDHLVEVQAFDGALLSEPASVTYGVGTPAGATHYWPILGTMDGAFSGPLPDSVGALDLDAWQVGFVTGRDGLGRGAAHTDDTGNHGLLTTEPIMLGSDFSIVTHIDFGNVFSDIEAFGQSGRFVVLARSSGLTLEDLSGSSVEIGRADLGSDWESNGFMLLVVTVEGSTISLYINDQPALTGTVASVDPNCSLFFGRPDSVTCTSLDPAQEFENGLAAAFDDIRVYDRALSANEVAALALTL